MVVCGAVKHAVKAEQAGCDAVICQGGEGGGHTGLVGTLPLVAQAVEAVKIPVVGRRRALRRARPGRGAQPGRRRRLDGHPLHRQPGSPRRPDVPRRDRRGDRRGHHPHPLLFRQADAGEEEPLRRGLGEPRRRTSSPSRSRPSSPAAPASWAASAARSRASTPTSPPSPWASRPAACTTSCPAGEIVRADHGRGRGLDRSGGGACGRKARAGSPSRRAEGQPQRAFKNASGLSVNLSKSLMQSIQASNCPFTSVGRSFGDGFTPNQARG